MLRGETQATFDIGDELRARGLQPDLAHRVFEEKAIFGFLDRIDFGADEFDAIFV